MSELTKEQIKGPDSFQKFSNKLVQWAQKNRLLVNSFLGVLLISGIVYAGYDLYKENVEEKGSVALFEAQRVKKDLDEKSAQLKTQNLEKPAIDKKTEAKTPPPKPAVKVTETEVTALEDQLVSAYQKVVNEYPQTRAGVIAALYSSQILLDQKKPDEAQKLFDKTQSPSRRNHFLTGAYLTQKGKVLAAKGDCETAVKEWEKVYQDSALQPWHGDSLVKAGICFEKLQKKDRAIELYKKASNEFGETDAGRTAKKFLILAERPAS